MRVLRRVPFCVRLTWFPYSGRNCAGGRCVVRSEMGQACALPTHYNSMRHVTGTALGAPCCILICEQNQLIDDR